MTNLFGLRTCVVCNGRYGKATPVCPRCMEMARQGQIDELLAEEAENPEDGSPGFLMVDELEGRR